MKGSSSEQRLAYHVVLGLPECAAPTDRVSKCDPSVRALKPHYPRCILLMVRGLCVTAWHFAKDAKLQESCPGLAVEAEIAGGMLIAPWSDCHTGSAFCAVQLLPCWYLLSNIY